MKQEKRKYASIVVLRDNLQLELGKQRYLKERMREQEERKVCAVCVVGAGNLDTWVCSQVENLIIFSFC